MTSGHQRGEGRSRKTENEYFDDRAKKLSEQKFEISKQSGILAGTRVHIDGYLEDTTDIEMKRILVSAGAQVS